MIYLLALLAAYAPAIGWLAFVYSRGDRYGEASKRLMATLFVLGLGATAPAVWVNQFIVHGVPAIVPGAYASLIVFGLAAFGEELFKLAFGALRIVDRTVVVEPLDGVIYLSAVALGFAAAENTTYIVDTALGLGSGGATDLGVLTAAFLSVAPERALVTTLGHVAWSGIAGYYTGRWILGRSSRAKVVAALAAAGVLHAAFNIAADRAASGDIAGRLVAFAAWLFALGAYMSLFRRALRASPARTRQLAIQRVVIRRAIASGTRALTMLRSSAATGTGTSASGRTPTGDLGLSGRRGLLWLAIVSGTRAGERIRVDQRLIIGRGGDCDVVLADTEVSRHHVELAPMASRVMLRDLRSQNGTFVDGVRAATVVLLGGERIRVGKTELLVEPRIRAGEVDS